MPPPQILPAIANILQVSIDALFGKKEEAPAISEELDQNLIKEWKEELEKIEKDYVSWKVRQTESPMAQLITCYEKLLRLAKNQQEELLVMQTELITIKELITLFRK